MKFVPMDPINNIQALFQIMAWHQSGDKPLSEPMMFFIYGPIYASLGLTDKVERPLIFIKAPSGGCKVCEYLTHWGLMALLW